MCNVPAVLAKKLYDAFQHFSTAGAPLGLPKGSISWPLPKNVTTEQVRKACDIFLPKGEGTLWQLDTDKGCVVFNLLPCAAHRMELPIAQEAVPVAA